MKYSMVDRDQKAKLEIVSISVERVLDVTPDLSWLGEYSDLPGDVHIDRVERGDYKRGQLRYFNVSQNYADCSESGQRVYMQQDYERMERYNRGEWCMLGIKAKAVVARKVNGGSQLHEFESGVGKGRNSAR